MLTPLELAEKQKFRTQVESGEGAYKMALEVCRLSTSCKDFKEYKRKKTFILEGKLLQMVADCMEYDYPKLQKSMLKKLDDCYLKVSSSKSITNLSFTLSDQNLYAKSKSDDNL